MPKYAVHMIVMDEVVEKLRSSSNPAERQIGEIMYANRKMAVLGAIGPDLYFWSPDYDIVRIPYKFYENFKWIIDLYNNTIGKVKEAIAAAGEAVEEAVETLAPTTVAMIKSLIEEIRETSGLLKSTLSTGLLAGVVEGYDFLAGIGDFPKVSHTIFDMFIPPLQNGEAENRWYWFDILHYRETGKFAQNLLRFATTDEQKAYVYGYLTHIATDTVGHPFVNQIVGGPYRMHPQRHATCENFIDSWKFHKKYGESVNSTLHAKMNLPENIPPSIAEMSYRAFHETYGDKPHPTRINPDGFLTVKDINTTYEVFYFVLETLGGMHVEEPKEPFSGVMDILNEALERFEAPPAPPAGREMCGILDIFSFGLTERSRECYENFVEAIGEWLGYIGDLLEWAFETIWRLIDFLLAALLSLPITVLMAILYGIQLALYQLLKMARSVLVLNGFLYPEPDEVFGTSHGRNLTTPYQCAIAPFKRAFPHRHAHDQTNLECPATPIEDQETVSAWYAPDPSSDPDKFIKLDRFNIEAVRAYAAAMKPADTRKLEASGLAIGNAVEFATWLITGVTGARASTEPENMLYAPWNLDSDRGYGYKCWALPTPTSITSTDALKEYYI